MNAEAEIDLEQIREASRRRAWRRLLTQVSVLVVLVALAVATTLALVGWGEEKVMREEAETDSATNAEIAQIVIEQLRSEGIKPQVDPSDIVEPEEVEPEVVETNDPEIQEREIQEPEDPDAERQDPENQDDEQQESEAQEPEEQEDEQQEPEIQDDEVQDPEIQDPEKDDPDPDDPPVCEGEFVCQDELDAAIANLATQSWVITLFQGLGCEVLDISGPVPTCEITGKP